MSEWYTVRYGDCLSSIGEEHGIPWKKIWEHAENQPLRDSRGDPNVLFPGDKVYIPDLEEKDDPKSDSAKHKYRASGGLDLRIAVLDVQHKPMSGIKYRYTVNGNHEPEASTGSDGLAKVRLPKHCSNVKLRLPWGTFPVLVGELDPARTIRGMQQRMRNLGIDPGPIDGIYGPKTARGIRTFQMLEGLEVTGQPSQEFIERLRKVHEQISLGGTHNDVEQHEQEQGEIADREDIDVSVGDSILDSPDVVHIDQRVFPVEDIDPQVDGV